MFEPDPSFRAVRTRDGYPPLEDLGLIRDGSTVALVGLFWLVDNLALQGRLDEAEELYVSLCDRASPLGLLSEQIDPSTGEFNGNFPQAFSHIGVVASGVTLARARAGAPA